MTSNSAVFAIVQARMGSERLRGKVFLPLDGHQVLWHVLERLRRCKRIDGIVVATSTESGDDAIVDFCEQSRVRAVRGPEADVLSRYQLAIDAVGASVVVRITADCPLIDPDIVDMVVGTLLDSRDALDYVSNTVLRSYPRGMDVEAFTASSFTRADRESRDGAWREHVTPAFYRLPASFKSRQVGRADPQGTANWRLTLDTMQDYEALCAIAAARGGNLCEASLADIEAIVHANPEILALNSSVSQKAV